VRFDQAGNSVTWGAAPTLFQSFGWAKQSQTLQIRSAAPQYQIAPVINDASMVYTVTATANSTLTPVFSIDTSSTTPAAFSGFTQSNSVVLTVTSLASGTIYPGQLLSAPTATFVGSLTGVTLTVSQPVTNQIAIGMTVRGSQVVPNTVITSQVSGPPGQDGVYLVSRSSYSVVNPAAPAALTASYAFSSPSPGVTAPAGVVQQITGGGAAVFREPFLARP